MLTLNFNLPRPLNDTNTSTAEVGNGGLTDDEAVSHFSLWAALKSPLLMTNVMSTIDAATLSIQQNTPVLAVSQDPSTSSAVRIWRHYVDDGEIQLYSGTLSGGDQVMLLLNGGSVAREMNATLADIFWEDGPYGTADQVKMSWDIYDLWADRMSNHTANRIIAGDESARPINMTAMGGSQKVYNQVPLPDTKALMGSKIGTVQPGGTVKAQVKPHGVAMYRLRERQTKKEL